MASFTRRLLAASAFLALAGAAREAAAGNTCTWSGTTSTFASAANWTNCGSTYPGSADVAQFNGTSLVSCSIPSGTTLAGLTITNAYTGTVSLGASLTVAGSLSVNGSNLNAGTGTVTLTGTSSQSLKSGNDILNNLVINSSGTYTLTGALRVAGSLTITSGTLSTSTFATTITGDLILSGGALTGGTGATAIGGNVTIANNVTNGSDPSLVGYWTLDETASPAADSSGQGNPLVWNSSPASSTSVPSSITFTDSHSLSMTGTQYAGTSSTLASLSELTPSTVTLSAWYKANNVDTSGGEIVSGSNTYGLRITSTGAMVMKRITDNTAAADWIEYRVSLSNVLDGNWHQIVGVIQPGTGGSMSLYFDGVVAAGSYWVNGSSGATQLSSTTSPTAATAASAAIDWNSNTEGYGLIVGNNPSTTGYHFGAGCSAGACAIDDVRVYNRALTAAEVAALAHGNQPGGTTGVVSLSGNMTVTGSVSVQATGTLTLNSGGNLKVGTALTMDGTLNATGGTIQGATTTKYAFTVGSTSAAAPELNINGLTVKNTDSNGMWINANTGAATTFTRFDSIAFSSGTGAQLLQIYAPSLFLTSNGCTFDASTTYAIKMTGNGTGSGAGPRALFGNATCGTNDSTTGLCASSEKSDDDANNDGVADHPTTNGAVVQFVRGGQSDTDGTIVGFPTAAFDWNSFTYYSTYVTFHDASNGSDVVYVRDEGGNPLYSWTDPTVDETIVGTPQWTTISSKHYLYVVANGGSSNSGKVYRLIDTGTGTTSGTLTLDTTWASSGVYSCSCTVSSNLSLDASNIYWAATNGSQVLMGITQSAGAKISTSWPVTTPNNVTTSSPALSTKSGTTTLYLGITNDLLQLAVTGTTFVQNTKPRTITGRVTVGTSLLSSTLNTSRVYAGDSSGTMWAISPTNFSGTNFLWSYASGGAIANSTYDGTTDTVQFGTAGGKVVVLTAGTGAVLNSAYPYTLDTSDPISAAPLYSSGVLVVGTSKGKLYFLDRNTGTGVSVIKTYSFGSGQSISTVAFDPIARRYMISTSSAASDGRLYYFDLVSDPTSASL